MNRGDLLSWENRTDVFDGELLHSWAHSLLSAVPPQSHHGRQVLHCAVVHTARQVRELPVKAVTFCSKEFVNKKKTACVQILNEGTEAVLEWSVLTVHRQRQTLCEEGLGLLGLHTLAGINWILRHEFEEMQEEFVQGTATPQVLGVMCTKLGKNQSVVSTRTIYMFWHF